MANPLRKTMVYLGLADEEYEYEAQQQQPSAPAAPVEKHAPTAAAQAPRPAAVTPLRRSAPSAQAPAHEMNEILTVHPRAFRDVQVIAEHFRDGVPVIINITQMTDAEARRLIDFSCGLAEALSGRIERVTGKVFLLSPAHVAISGDQGEVESDLEASFF